MHTKNNCDKLVSCYITHDSIGGMQGRGGEGKGGEGEGRGRGGGGGGGGEGRGRGEGVRVLLLISEWAVGVSQCHAT